MKPLIILTAILHSALGVKYAVPTLNWTNFSLDEWWGVEDTQDTVNTSIRDATIEFSDEMITDLRNRLNYHIPFKAPLNGSAFTYGVNSDALLYWIKYWAEQYDFKTRETYLNTYPQKKVNIQGIDIHYIHVKPETNKTIVPLLLLHGWPGSIREFYEAIPLLTAVDDNRDFAVEVLCPCLPGFGFSNPAVRPGLGSVQIAILLRNFMKTIGYDEWYVQGGDIGGVIANHMVTLFSQEVKGYHTNFAFIITLTNFALQGVGALNPSFLVEPALQDRMYPLLDVIFFLMEETGYFHIQATKPDTIGTALTDSPSGLLAYVLEKFSTVTNPANRLLSDGGLYNTYTPEQLLDNLMMYWVPRSMTTSMRIYAETFNKKQVALGLDNIASPVPTCVLQAKHEMAYQPPLILKMKFTNLLNATVLDYGGHFFALEQPVVYSESVLSALSQFIEWHKYNEISA